MRSLGAAKSVSIIIATFNGAARIGNSLEALVRQTAGFDAEILVVDDGSTDNVEDVVAGYAAAGHRNIRFIRQKNAGPAAARNRGAVAAHAPILLFIDDDCVPTPGWLEAMLGAMEDPEIVAAKGIYCTTQKSIVARFVQLEYEDKYRRMARYRYIDFIDTYSAAFRRDRFLMLSGFDTSFPVACAEDAELSFRMSSHGWKMKLVPDAVVRHTHPDTLVGYLKKKYKFSYWRVVAVKKHPRKLLNDSHTPQVMKLQLLLAPLLLASVVFDLVKRPMFPTSILVLFVFVVSTLPFTLRAIGNDLVVGLLSPVLLALRACAQGLGVMGGLIHAYGSRGVEFPADQGSDSTRLPPVARTIEFRGQGREHDTALISDNHPESLYERSFGERNPDSRSRPA